jgi:predicted regulator of Ras-like GTPase activity (Roadblock/LC7/MglB family)
VLPGIKAVMVLGPRAELLDFATTDLPLDPSVLASEYGTLLRIVERTAKDTGMGDLQQQIVISSSSMVVLQHLPRERVLVVVCSPGEHLGRLRYELKRSLLYSTLSNL